MCPVLLLYEHIGNTADLWFQQFVIGYLLLSFLFLESLNDLHINTVSIQQGYSKDIAIYIDNYEEYEADPFGLL